MNIKMLVAMHKECKVPEGECYLPIQVGAVGKESISEAKAIDSTGDNISRKNANYCELTALYWAWKNLDVQYIGLCHYRRYFKGKHGIATEEEIEHWVKQADIVLPRARNYFIETNYSHYAHAHHEKDLLVAKSVIAEKCPEYLSAWEDVMRRSRGHRFNMFITSKEIVNEYCEWLFAILFEIEKKLDISDYSDYDKRTFGFIAERLLDVWIVKEGVSYIEKRIYETERVDWFMKGFRFIARFVKGRINELLLKED